MHRERVRLRKPVRMPHCRAHIHHETCGRAREGLTDDHTDEEVLEQLADAASLRKDAAG